MATPRHPLGDSMEANMHRRVEPSNLASAVDVTTPVGTSVAQQSGQIKIIFNKHENPFQNYDVA